MTDDITIRGLRCRGRHGVLAAESELGQVFVVDASLSLDTAPAAVSDEVADTVDYGELVRRLAAVVEGEPVHLMETLAVRLAELCLANPRVAAAEVTVHKPQAPVAAIVKDIAVTVRRSRT